MSPRMFDSWRHVWALVQLCVLLGVSVICFRRRSKLAPVVIALSDSGRRAFGFVLRLAWFAVALALVGLCIDLFLSNSNPDLASRLLRFYWFRWCDVVVPLAGSLVMWWSLSRNSLGVEFPTQTLDDPPAVIDRSGTWQVKRLALIVLGLTVSGCFASHLYFISTQDLPPADAILERVVGPHNKSQNRYLDWLAVCDWIEKNTPSNAVFMTPPYQQTFKWHAGRAEAWSWKDIPQDNAAVIEWYRRKNALALRRDSVGNPVDWSTDELIERAQKYGFRWVLLDRSYQVQPPSLEMMYPIGLDNRSFAVMRIPDSLLQNAERSTIPP